MNYQFVFIWCCWLPDFVTDTEGCVSGFYSHVSPVFADGIEEGVIELCSNDQLFASICTLGIDLNSLEVQAFAVDLCKEKNGVKGGKFSKYTSEFESSNSSKVLDGTCLLRYGTSAPDACLSKYSQEPSCLNHSLDAVLQCKTGNCTSDIRISEGGRVEFCLNGGWTTFCYDSWDNKDAQVVCRYLGYPATFAFGFKYTKEITGNYAAIKFHCLGNETDLNLCHSEATDTCSGLAGAVCQATGVCSNGDVMLDDVNTVKYCSNGIWGGVCDDNWDHRDAVVVCRQLGLSGGVAFQGSSLNAPIWLDEVNCTGDELLLSSCSHNDLGNHDCIWTQVAGVICEPPKSSADNTSLVFGLVTAAVLIFLIVMVCVTAIVLCRKSLSSVGCVSEPSSQESTYTVNSENRNWNFDENVVLSDCLIEKSSIKLIEKIGQGEFGVVYHGLLISGKQTHEGVAIKTLKGSFSQLQAKQIVQEALKMKGFDHPHVLPLIGVCLDLLNAPCIIMPFMSGRSLQSFLRKEVPDLRVSNIADESIINDATKKLLSMCLQVAEGMWYLTQQKFVHRDLATRNCMISSEGVIKVADFGLTEDVYTTKYYKIRKDSSTEQYKLPIKWMALESIHHGVFSEKTDVWSFGVLCWEVFSLGRMPYPGLGPSEVVHMLDTGERLDRPLNITCNNEIYSLMISCWSKSPDMRPSFKELVYKLEESIAPLADYMDFTENYCTT